jgi:hypothetical protein
MDTPNRQLHLHWATARHNNNNNNNNSQGHGGGGRFINPNRGLRSDARIGPILVKPRHGPIVVSKEAVPILTEQLAEVSPDVARRVAEGAEKPAKRGSDAGRVPTTALRVGLGVELGPADRRLLQRERLPIRLLSDRRNHTSKSPKRNQPTPNRTTQDGQRTIDKDGTGDEERQTDQDRDPGRWTRTNRVRCRPRDRPNGNEKSGTL